MLLLTMEDTTFQKQSSKGHAFMAFGSDDLKVVFALLIEVVVFHVQVAIIKIRVWGL